MKIPDSILDVAYNYLINRSVGREFQFQLREKLTRETLHGWVFIANSDMFLKGKGKEWSCPIAFIVNKSDHTIFKIGTNRRIEFYIDEFERQFE